MAWEGSTRKARLPADWAARRRRVLARDGWRCVAVDDTGARCSLAATDVDHVKRGDDHSEDNLQSLCPWHHGKKSAHEGVEARRPRPARLRPREPHPAFRRSAPS